MKNIFKVFKRDIKSIFTNPIALLIIGGLCIIPSLYAWVNIKACWDPYTDTSSLPVAVVNEDAGADMMGKNINIGDGVISELKTNKSIGWQFVSQSDANAGVLSGKYYAVIEIPTDFSKDLASLTTNDPTKAEIIYKVNTKENPVAGKITEVAETTLVNQIRTSFLESVNKEVFSNLNGLGTKLDQNKDNIIKLKNSVININNNMGALNNVLDGVSTGANSLNDYINAVKSALPQISSSLSNVQNITANTGSIIDNTNSTLSAAFNNINLSLQSAKSNMDNVQGALTNLNSNSITAQQAKQSVATITSTLNNVKSSVTAVSAFLESMNKANPNNSVSSMISNLNNVNSAIQNQLDTLGMANNAIDSAGKVKQSIIDSLTSGASTISNGLTNSINNYNNGTKADLQTIGGNLSSATGTAVNLIGQANGLVGKMQDVVNSASSNTQLAQSTAQSLKATMNQFSGVISELAKNLSTINDNNLSQIISVLQGNPVVMGNFISSPFNVQEQKVFPIANYGSGMAPLYTVLAIWVGALLLTSLLKTHPPQFEGIEKISTRERYFGKLLTFISITTIQGLIVTLGDKYLLGVQTANLPLFIAMGVITSMVFCAIIFTLVSLFGNFGKAIAIVLMIVQIAGTGGTYPVQVLPLFFRIVEPIMPFSYAVDGFREAVAGPIFSHVRDDIGILLVFGLGTLLIAYFLTPILHNRLTKFEAKFEESGIGE